MIILYDCLLSTSGETIINVLMIMVIVSLSLPQGGIGEGPGGEGCHLKLVEEVAGGLAVTLSLPKGRSVGP
jgi:hypothetical protein